MKVGESVKRYRRAAGLSQTNLAEKLGCGVATVQRIEQGKAQPKERRLQEIAAALGVSVDELTGAEKLRGFDTPAEFQAAFESITEGQRELKLSYGADGVIRVTCENYPANDLVKILINKILK